MARARNVKPGFFKNEELGALPISARLMFIGLWTLADREGRLEDRPARIAAEIFPYDRAIGINDIDTWLTALAGGNEKFIERYSVGQTNYIQITNFKKHQSPHVKEQASTIPAPGSPGARLVHAPDRPLPPTVPAPPDSLNPSSLNPSTKTCASDDARDDSLHSIDDPPFDNLPVSDKPAKPDPKANLTAEQTVWFGEFWGEYWLLKAKKSAQAAFAKHVRTPGRFREVMAGVRTQKTEMFEKEASKRPYAATWLHGERWNDEVLSDAQETRASGPNKLNGVFSDYEEIKPTKRPQEAE
jgi:hypothetical protein